MNLTQPKQPATRPANWDAATINEFIRRWGDLFEWAHANGIPNPVKESMCRDTLAGVEATRLLGNLVNQGVTQLNLPRR